MGVLHLCFNYRHNTSAMGLFRWISGAGEYSFRALYLSLKRDAIRA